MPNSDYIRLKDSLVNKLQNDHNFTLLYNLKIGVAPCIRSKMDHGDLDIIVGTNYSNTGLDLRPDGKVMPNFGSISNLNLDMLLIKILMFSVFLWKDFKLMSHLFPEKNMI
jgi:hypothetical protein